MNTELEDYPPNPSPVPADLTTPTAGYRTQVLIVLASLVLFLVLYVGLLVGSAWVSYRCFSELTADSSTRHLSPSARGRRGSPVESNSIVFVIIGGLSSAALCLFLVKGLFKRSAADESLKLEVKEADQPQLFAFIRQLCRDTRAPFPHRVYVTPDVNAAVFYHESVLNLILPAPKNLLIGLGLVNSLNLTEFKAVLAHEFGHFSQNSMKLGRYVYVSNRIIGDMVFRRDWLDDLVGAVSRIDIRIAIIAWVFMGVLWVVRKVLQGLFRLINFANSALSRQMEFSADLVAVSVSGSDALINALSRLDFAAEALGTAWSDLRTAADHQLYTTDLYYHQSQAANYLQETRKILKSGPLPPVRGDSESSPRLFQAEDTSAPKMWATHPSNFDREENAKRRYIAGPQDARSPWILFQNRDALRKLLSWQLYQSAMGVVEVTQTDAREVQAFIDAERAETNYDPRYQGMYDDRYIKPGDLEQASTLAKANFVDEAQLAAAHSRLLGAEFPARMESNRQRQGEHSLLLNIVHGAVELRGKDFSFRGTRRPAADAKRLAEQVEKELESDYEWLAELDRQSLLIHCEMARRLEESLQVELLDRYRFQLAIQEIHITLSHYFVQAQQVTQAVSGNSSLSQEDFATLRGVLQQAHEALRESLERAGKLKVPQFKNFDTSQSLQKYLLNRPLAPALSGGEGSLDGKWIGTLFGQIGEVIERVKRLHFKSLGNLLTRQEQIVDRWSAVRGSEEAKVSPPIPSTESV